MPKVTLNLNEDMIATLERVASAAEITAPVKPVRLAAAIQLLADNWEAGQPDIADESPTEVERKARISKAVDRAILEGITSPDISLDLTTHHSRSTPRAADDLVPWEYILAGYPRLEFVADATAGSSEKDDARIEVIREVLTKVPEDQWETEQVRSVIARAFERLG